MSRRRQKGTGSLRLRGSKWEITYYQNFLPIVEQTDFSNREDAERLLAQRIGEMAAGKDLAPSKATVSDLCRLVIADYRLRKLRDLRNTEWRFDAHLKPAIGGVPAGKLSHAQIQRYIESRRVAGASEATINRELSILRRGYTLAMREDPPVVTRAPHIPKLEEAEARQGFLEPEQYEILLSELPDRLKALFVCGYHVGTRKGELRKIRWSQVDWEGLAIRLSAGQTKAKTARTLPIYGDMEHWLRYQLEHCPEGCQWVFYYDRRRQIGEHLKGWDAACVRAGVPGLLFHDLRRSAVRNMKRAGVQDSEAMKISGHKTRAIFDRYNIVDEKDIQNAAAKMGKYLEERRAKPAKLQRVK